MQEIRKRVEKFKRKNSERSILQKLKALQNGRKIMENDADDVKEKILFQHNSVKQLLSEIYEHQISAINNSMNDELSWFNTEEQKLKQLKETRENLRHLFQTSNSRSLIQQCEELMLAHKKFSTKINGIWRKPKYIEPKKESFVPSEEMFTFWEIHILGYSVFQPMENGEIGGTEYKILQTYRKSKQSHNSVEIPPLNWQNTELDFLSIGTSMKSLPSFTLNAIDNVPEPIIVRPDTEHRDDKKGEGKVSSGSFM